MVRLTQGITPGDVRHQIDGISAGDFILLYPTGESLRLIPMLREYGEAELLHIDADQDARLAVISEEGWGTIGPKGIQPLRYTVGETFTHFVALFSLQIAKHLVKIEVRKNQA